MFPARLYNPYMVILKVRDGLAQKIWTRHKIGIKNSDKLTVCKGHSVFECTSLKALTLFPADLLNLIAQPLIMFNFITDNLYCFIRRIIYDMNFKTIPGVVECTYGINQTLNNIHFVVYRELNRYKGRFFAFSHCYGLPADYLGGGTTCCCFKAGSMCSLPNLVLFSRN